MGFIFFLMIFSFPSFLLCLQRTEKEVDSNAGKEEQLREKMSSVAEKSMKNRQTSEQRKEES